MSSNIPLSKSDLDTILVLDFGSQYTQLIARRVRELECIRNIPMGYYKRKISL